MSRREFQNEGLWVSRGKVRKHRIGKRSFGRPERWLGRGEELGMREMRVAG